MPSKNSYHWTDPSSSQTLEAPAGETIRIGFRVSNDMPKPVGFKAVAEGLPEEWLPAPEVMFVGPYDSGEATFLVTPPYDSALGEYELSVKLFEGNSERWGEPRLVRITLSEPLEEPRSAPVYEPVYEPEPEPEPAPPPPAPKAKTPRVAKPKAEPVIEDTPEPEFATPEPVAVEPVVVEPVIATPEPPAPEVVEKPITATPSAPAPPKAEPKPVVEAAPTPTPVEPPKPKPAPPKPQPAPAATFEPKIIDFEPEKKREPVVAPKPAADRTVVDPKDGQILPIRPGETVLVKVPFDNATGTRGITRTFVIQENRALPRDWIEVERDQVSVTAGGSGFVSVRLKPPLGAEPTAYPFVLEIGPIGEPLEPRSLILDVQPTPAVSIACEKTSAMVWFKRDAEFDLTVAVAGNSDTAYRLVPLADPDGPKPPEGGVRPIAPVVGFWRRLIDRELGNLASPVTNRRPAPEKHKVKLRREGIWWFGWQEKHTATLEAVPVTDGANGAKPGNRVALAATRRRLLPVPWFVAAPIAILLFAFLSGGPTDLRVSNAVVEANGVSYVVAKNYAAPGTPQTVDVELAWKDAILPAGGSRVDGTNRTSFKGHIDGVTLNAEYQKPLTYNVGGLMGGPSTEVVVLGQRTKGALSLKVNDQTVATHPSKDKLANGAYAAELDISVPAGKTITLTMKNEIPPAMGSRVWLFQTRQPSAFSVGGLFQNNGTDAEMGAGDTRPVKISRREGGGDTDVWELVTTDASMPVLRVRLKAVN